MWQSKSVRKVFAADDLPYRHCWASYVPSDSWLTGEGDISPISPSRRLRRLVSMKLSSEFFFCLRFMVLRHPCYHLLQLQLARRGVNMVQNVGDVLCRRSVGQKSPSGVQGRSPGRGSGGRSPPEAEAILDFYMHNFDLILNYFCFASATSGWLMLRNGSCLSMK